MAEEDEEDGFVEMRLFDRDGNLVRKRMLNSGDIVQAFGHALRRNSAYYGECTVEFGPGKYELPEPEQIARTEALEAIAGAELHGDLEPEDLDSWAVRVLIHGWRGLSESEDHELDGRLMHPVVLRTFDDHDILGRFVIRRGDGE